VFTISPVGSRLMVPPIAIIAPQLLTRPEMLITPPGTAQSPLAVIYPALLRLPPVRLINPVVRPELKLPRFRGHRNVCVQGVRDGQDKIALRA
jgi:hypothetical protein